ncbi:MAG: ABC transporter permease [Kofleriaceae bacterium]
MIGAALGKELALLARDRGTVISLFALPIVFIVVFGSMFKFGPDGDARRPVAVWAAPGDPRGAAVVTALDDAPGFRAVPAADAAAVRAQVAAEDAVAGLIVPPDFAPGAHPVELAIDLGQPLAVRAPLQGALTALVGRALLGAPPGAELAVVEARTPPGLSRPLDDITSFQVTVPGNAVLFGFFIALSVAMAFAEERRSGAWRRSLAAPVRRRTLLLAKLVPFFVIGLGQLGFLFGLGALAFGMRVAGSPLALVALSVLVVACAVALGLAFASLGGSEKQLGGVGSVVLLVMGLLGGCMLPRLVMPPLMQQLGLAVPHGWALDGYYAVLVRQGTGIVEIAPQLGGLAAFTTLFALFGAWRFRFER